MPLGVAGVGGACLAWPDSIWGNDDWKRRLGSGQFIDREGWALIGGDV
jgi:hypothetical protein